MINWIWMGLLTIGLVSGMVRELQGHAGSLEKITKAAVSSANNAV